MKLLFLIGDGAVGKMTVGQELCKRTGLRLFHNHMTIEPVMALFDTYNHQLVSRLREAIFEEFAASDQYGMIFTFMWAFDQQGDWDYIRHVTELFEAHGAEIYCAELVAPLEVRLQRNRTENRLHHKPSKRDLEASDERLCRHDKQYRLESLPGEIPFEHYIKIDNTDLSPEEAAKRIQEYFHF